MFQAPIKASGKYAVTKSLASLRGVSRSQDCRNRADPARTCFKHGVDIIQGDSADRKPGTGDFRRGPSDIFKRNRFGCRFRVGGKYRAHREIVCPRQHGTLGLVRRVRAQSDPHRDASRFGIHGSQDFAHMRKAGIEEILLSQVTDWSAHGNGNGWEIIDHEPNSGGITDGQKLLSNSLNVRWRGPFEA
jgi:hypothetical protein